MAQEVILDEIRQEDIELIRTWRNQEHIRSKFLNSELISSEQQSKWFEKYVQNDSDKMYLIKSKLLHSKPVGTVALYNINSVKKTAEFGRLMIGESEAHGKGIGFAASKEMCRIGFYVLNLERIHLQVFGNNFSAKKIYDSIGFNVVNEQEDNGEIVLDMLLNKDEFINE